MLILLSKGAETAKPNVSYKTLLPVDGRDDAPEQEEEYQLRVERVNTFYTSNRGGLQGDEGCLPKKLHNNIQTCPFR